ncbi:MAG: cytidylate kinase-like family protein [Massilibacteroides sp.]|nr:cytidylate kinase-like family protein [Massilibacteroides sp.]
MENNKNKAVITIGRQYGSGGRAIGKLLSEKLGIAYYDKELLTEAAKESGICEEMFKKMDEKESTSFFRANSIAFFGMNYFAPSNDYLSNEGLFRFQSEAIRKLAKKGEGCVIVGRCADYILRECPNRISVFFHSSKEKRLARIMQRNDFTLEKARDVMTKADKTRSSYYNYYTNKSWGDVTSYDLSVNVDVLGITGTMGLIKQFTENRIMRLNSIKNEGK